MYTKCLLTRTKHTVLRGGGRALPVESQDAMTAEKLLEKQAKWHRDCRRTFQWDRLANTGSPTTYQTSHREPRPSRRSSTSQQDCSLFCEEGASGKRPLHEFQKMCLTEELRTKALRMHDWKVLNKLTVGDLVANELKYHAMCLVIFRRRFKTDTAGTKTCHQDTCNKAIEEVLTMINEHISAGRTCFPLKDI